MISRTSQLALRAVLYLASADTDAPIRVDDVAAGLSVPRNYLSKILHALARAGVLQSVRGPAGGFLLAGDASDLVLSDVVVIFDPPYSCRQCLLGRKECSDVTPCAAHGRWKAIQDQLQQFFRETSVADLLTQRSRK